MGGGAVWLRAHLRVRISRGRHQRQRSQARCQEAVVHLRRLLAVTESSILGEADRPDVYKFENIERTTLDQASARERLV